MYFAQFHPDRSWSRQYMSFLFYRDEAQKKIAFELGGERAKNSIVPHVKFWNAENYHQKYYLRNSADLFREVAGYDDQTLRESTLAARLNGFLGGHGTKALLEKELESYGLSESGRSRVMALARR